MKKVLVVNSGSSSLKYQLIDVDTHEVVARGLIERIGESSVASSEDVSGLPPVDARHTRSPETSSEDPPETVTAPRPGVPDHTAAFRLMLGQLSEQGVDLDKPLLAIGHRVVHGGERFCGPTLITDDVLEAIDELSSLAPLHNPHSVSGIRAAMATFPGVPQVAVFDTAFHQTLAPAAYSYAIDHVLAAQHGVRRYGFHGTSFQYVSAKTAAFLGRPLAELKLIVLHLGNGASACAIDGGRSVETSMGMTPLEGLMMGTRGGDIDPGALIHLQRSGLSVDDIDRLLNHGSGLLGFGGHGDVRDVQAAADAGDEQAALALEVYFHRIRHYVGAYLAQLGRIDALVFTAGVGENNARVRAGVLAGLDGLGLVIDDTRNALPSQDARCISPNDSAIAVLVVPTNEEREIAREAARLV